MNLEAKKTSSGLLKPELSIHNSLNYMQCGFKRMHEMNAPKQRYVPIDIAKGIGIILVVFGHTFQIYSVTSYVYAFHMPLFFLLSGYTFNFEKNLRTPVQFLKRTFLRLMVPYFGGAIISYILYAYLAPTLSLPDISVNSAALGILNGNGINLPFDDVLWFLPALFLAGLIFLLLGLMFDKVKLLIGVTLISVSGILVGLYSHLPFGLDIAMTTQLFIYCGYLFRRANLLEKIERVLNKGFLAAIALSAMLLMSILSYINGRIDLMTRIYGQPVIFFIAGISGSISVLLISVFFSLEGRGHNTVRKILQTTGKASMYTFISHVPIFYCIASICTILFGFWIYYTYATYWYVLLAIGLSVPTAVYLLVTSMRHQKETRKSLLIERL